MTQVLSDIFGREDLHLRNSLEAKKVVDEVQVKEGEVLVSFDVISMFTNIPLELAKRIIRKRWREVKIAYGIAPELLDGILDFLLRECATFVYKERTYRQIRGLAMGSPMSPFLAQVVMTDLVF